VPKRTGYYSNAARALSVNKKLRGQRVGGSMSQLEMGSLDRSFHAASKPGAALRSITELDTHMNRERNITNKKKFELKMISEDHKNFT